MTPAGCTSLRAATVEQKKREIEDEEGKKEHGKCNRTGKTKINKNRKKTFEENRQIHKNQERNKNLVHIRMNMINSLEEHGNETKVARQPWMQKYIQQEGGEKTNTKKREFMTIGR